jgi:hypothetical protein
MCKQHLDKFNDNFYCSFCDQEHQIPQDGFPKSIKIMKMIDFVIQLDPLRKKIVESFDSLRENILKYQEINPDSFIYNYFSEIRNQVDLHRDELKKEIDDKSDEIIQQLKEKEERCKLNAQKIEKVNLNELKNNDLEACKQFATLFLR